MRTIKNTVTIIFVFCTLLSAKAQQVDSTIQVFPQKELLTKKNYWNRLANKKKFPLKSLLIPAALVSYGFSSLENPALKNVDQDFKEDIFSERPHPSKQIDNFLQFAPAISVYSLNAMGINGKNNFRDRTMLFFLSNIILNLTVHSFKKWSHQLRPDGSNYHSFPSGHTAEAFASAEFMRQEYKHISPWYGVAGYTMAAATGYMRMYNNKHWFSDVVAGAGIGIVSTKIAYWLYPLLQKYLWKKKMSAAIIKPFYLLKICTFN